MGQTSHNNPCRLNMEWGKKQYKTETIKRYIFPRATTCLQSRAYGVSWPSLAVWLSYTAKKSSIPCLIHGLNMHIFHNELASLAFFWGQTGLHVQNSMSILTMIFQRKEDAELIFSKAPSLVLTFAWLSVIALCFYVEKPRTFLKHRPSPQHRDGLSSGCFCIHLFWYQFYPLRLSLFP